jgi:hypothetical protein
MSGVTTDYRFAPIPEQLLFDPAIDPTAKCVYAVLMRHGMTPGDCYPSHKRIGELLGMSPRSIQRPLRALEESGWVLRVPRSDDRGDRISDGFHVRTNPDPGAHTNAPTAQESAHPTAQESAHPTRSGTRTGEREPDNESQMERESASTSSSLPVPSRPVPKGVDPGDVERLCQHLAARVTRHRGTAPKVTPAWQADMGTLLNSGAAGWDGPPPTAGQVAGVIDAVFDRLNVRSSRGFCWADQVRSPQGLRGKWEQLTFALREHQQAHPEASDVLAAMDMLDQMGVKR